MSIAVALSTGLLQGFLHCAGMCGPFVLAFGLWLPRGAGPAGGSAPGPRWRLLLAHNAGRIAVFAVLGALFGWIGSFVDAAARLTGVEAVAGIAGGALMVLWAIDQARTGHGGAGLERWSLLRLGPLQRAFRGLVGRRDTAAALLSGGLLGLHPCGLLFAMLLAAAATASPLQGALTLLAFGVGTLPALLSVAAAGSLAGARLRTPVFNRISAAVIAAGGVLFALRGLAVNGWVPHVWPWLF